LHDWNQNLIVQPVVLIGNHIRLEPLSENHVPGLTLAGRDPEIWRYLPYGLLNSEEKMLDHVRALLEKAILGTDLPFVVIHIESGQSVGCTRYLEISTEHKSVEIGGTWFEAAFQRTVVNTETKFLLLRYAFEDLGCIRVQFKTDLRNLRSQKALERIGAKREGVLRNHMLRADGQFRDSVYYSIIANEWTHVKTHLETKLKEPKSVDISDEGSPLPAKKPILIRNNVKKLLFSPTLGMNQQVNNARSDGVDLINMGFGQSPFPVHHEIRSALAANADKNMYLPSSGLPELRSIAGNYFGKKFGFNSNNFNVIIGPGSKELIFDIQLAVEGDLLMPVPSWVSYGPQAKLVKDHIIKIHTNLAVNYHVTPISLEKAILNARNEGKYPSKLILNYPNNPSGLSLSLEDLEKIAQVCRQYNILVISDEIYGLIDFGGGHSSIARFYPEGTIVTTGLSKHLSLGGYRLGVAMVPKQLNQVSDAVNSIASETWSSVSSPIQFAAVKAFQGNPSIETYIQRCTTIHKMISIFVREAIVDLGIKYPKLQGGFYMYPDFGIFQDKLSRRGIETSDQLAKNLLDELRIATLPGTDFGDDPDYLRLRLAVCDYNGEMALKYFQENPGCTPESLVNACCSNIHLACEQLRSYFK
jgi:aspartate/methionine/tyrosine aminotransferase/RimJ/RimL family protein N-acetyltransferase